MVAIFSGLVLQGASLAQSEQSSGSVEAQTGVATPSVVYPDTGRKKRKTPAPNRPALEPQTPLESNFESKYGISPQREAVSYLKKFKSRFPALSRSRLLLLKSEQLQKQFSERVFYVLRFMQWPVAVQVPEGLSSNTILVVNKKGKIEKILDEEDLKMFFNKNLKTVSTESDTRNILYVWLFMAKEFAQDGMFQFQQINSDGFKISKTVSGITASGAIKIVPMAGNEGRNYIYSIL